MSLRRAGQAAQPQPGAAAARLQAERLRQQRLLTLLRHCIDAALAKQAAAVEQQRQGQQQQLLLRGRPTSEQPREGSHVPVAALAAAALQPPMSPATAAALWATSEAASVASLLLQQQSEREMVCAELQRQQLEADARQLHFGCLHQPLQVSVSPWC